MLRVSPIGVVQYGPAKSIDGRPIFAGLGLTQYGASRLAWEGPEEGVAEPPARLGVKGANSNEAAANALIRIPIMIVDLHNAPHFGGGRGQTTLFALNPVNHGTSQG
jgi:hypothetical protein